MARIECKSNRRIRGTRMCEDCVSVDGLAEWIPNKKETIGKDGNSVDTTQNIISFCTGYGGIELGMRLAGTDVRTVAACEIETYAVANLVAKMEQGALEPFPIWTDLKTFDGRPFRGKVHGLIGGYPCQPFSCAGQRKGTDDPRHLWPYILEHIRTIRPVWCFFENVSGHLTLGFEEVFASLRELGYHVEAGLFTASEVGGPHKRKRLFIMAHGQRKQYNSNLHKRAGVQVDGRILCESAKDRLADTGSLHAASANSDGVDGRGICVLSRKSEVWDENCRRSQGHRWPARPNEPQYEWEEPRTVKPGVGRAVNGTASRVDELRLLGNGVVPQCAAKAWITLWEHMERRHTGV